jgi:hypothetical protein
MFYLPTIAGQEVIERKSRLQYFDSTLVVYDI